MRARQIPLLVPAAVLAALAFGVSSAAAATPCWQRIIDSWSAGSLDASYPPACYRTALDRLPEDVALYSSAQDDIGRELLAAISRQPAPRGATRSSSVPTVALVAGAAAVTLAVSLVAARVVGRRRMSRPQQRGTPGTTH